MNNLKQLNEAIFSHLSIKLPVFKDFTFSNNTITYKEENIELGDFNLQDFAVHNDHTLSDLSPESLFKILKVHTDTINIIIPPSTMKTNNILVPIIIAGAENLEIEDAKLISLDRFIALVNDNSPYTEEEGREIDRFFTTFSDLFVYEDYLIPQVKETFNIIKNTLITVEIDETIVTNQECLVNKFHDIVEEVNIRKENLFPIWDSEWEVGWDYLPNAGFVDTTIFLIILTDIGITLAVLLLFFKQ